jgi:hypothetical protein
MSIDDTDCASVVSFSSSFLHTAIRTCIGLLSVFVFV